MAWVRTEVDAVVTGEPCWLYNVILLASVAGGDVTLYDGVSTTNARKIVTLKGPENVALPVEFNPPVYCNNGLFVDVGSNVTEVYVSFEFGTLPGKTVL